MDHDHLIAMLNRLKLTAIRDQLDSLVDEAARRALTIRQALSRFCEREIARKDEASRWASGSPASRSCAISMALTLPPNPRSTRGRSARSPHTVQRVRLAAEHLCACRDKCGHAVAEIGNEPKELGNDCEARLHRVAPPVGRLPLGEERAIVVHCDD